MDSVNIFRHKSKLDKQLNDLSKSIKESISNDRLLEKSQEEENMRKQIWDSMSPRLKMRLLKYIDGKRNAKD